MVNTWEPLQTILQRAVIGQQYIIRMTLLATTMAGIMAIQTSCRQKKQQENAGIVRAMAGILLSIRISASWLQNIDAQDVWERARFLANDRINTFPYHSNRNG